jgi:hypothetical protein
MPQLLSVRDLAKLSDDGKVYGYFKGPNTTSEFIREGGLWQEYKHDPQKGFVLVASNTTLPQIPSSQEEKLEEQTFFGDFYYAKDLTTGSTTAYKLNHGIPPRNHLTRGEKIEGVIVTETEVSQGLGFSIIEDFRWFQQHIDEVDQIVKKKLQDWFGPTNHSQISFSISSAVLTYFLEQQSSKNQIPREDL